MATTQPYRIRPGRRSDIPNAVAVWRAAFSHDQLVELIVPGHRQSPETLQAYISRLFYSRWWTPNYDLDVICAADNDDELVGMTWWKRPDSALSFYERWLSPYAWFAPLVRAFHSVRDALFPIPNLDHEAGGRFKRTFSAIEPKLLNTPRRQSAWYLSTLAISPSLQGAGLGTLLLRHGMARADGAGAAHWLVGLKGVDGYYERHGFKEVGRANIGELSHWEGGTIMFRND